MKSEKEHIIDRISRELLEDFSIEAPEGAFYSIKRDLNMRSREKHKRVFLYMAASWAILLSFGLGYMYRSFTIRDSKTTRNTIAINTNKRESNSSKKIDVTFIDSKRNKDIINSVKEPNNIKTTSLIKDDKLTRNNNDIPTTNSLAGNLLRLDTKDSTKDSTIVVLSHNDSLKLIYKFISLCSSGITNDSATNQNSILAYQTPIPALEESSSTRFWTIAGGITPMMGFDLAGNSTQKYETNRLKSNVITSDQQLPSTKDISVSYSTGLSVKRNISEKWNIRTGLCYNKISKDNTDISYVEVPLMCEYQLINHTLKLYFTNGFGAGFKQTDIYPLGMSGFCFMYPLNKMVDINLEPTYKHVFGKAWTYKADYYGMMAGFSVKF